MNRATGSTAFAMQINEMAQEINKLRAEIAAERERRQFAEDGLKLFRDAKIQWRVRAEAAEAERDALRELLREAREVIAGTHIEQYVEPFAARIDAALNKGGIDEH